jgi:predicted ATPase/DNA-binding NarL/FixJ family response regulator
MAHSIAKARDGFLQEHTVQGTSLSPITIGTPAWYSWLEQHRSFSFETPCMTFTARKEQRPGGWYWYAYRRSQGKLHTAYLGKSEELTLERLTTAAQALERAGDTREGKTHRSPQAVGDTALQAQQASIIAFPTTRTVVEQPREPEPAPKHHLPMQLTPLIGREQEAASAAALLRRPEVRLLTMVGTAGIGKTRLAIQVAADLLPDFTDGVSFVSLAPIRNHNLVLPTVAQTLGLYEPGHEPEASRLRTFLQHKHLLLVLDNFEHVIAAVSQLLDLLTASPHLKLLVTSREVLHLRAEQQFAVPPLALPDLKHLPDSETLVQYPAVKLFLQRGQAVKHDFQITPTNAAIIAEICTRLDGLPLALELAAARIKLLSPPALLARLGHRLQVLTGGAHDLPERQRTLRATIAWSYELLSTQEQQLFRRLSIFVGGCTLEAVEAISAALGNGAESALDTVASLVDQSLLQRMEQEAQEEPRFVMLETIREYGLERLAASGEIEEVRRVHAAYFLALAEEASLKTEGIEQSAWLRQLDREHDNLRAAMAWSLEQTGSGREMALRLGIALLPFWNTRGYHSEGRSFLERALVSSDDVEDALRAGMLPTTQISQMQWQGMIALGFLWTERDYAQAGAWFRRASDLAERLADPTLRARSLNRLGNWLANTGQAEEGLQANQQALAIFEEQQDMRGMAETLDLLAMTYGMCGDRVKAVEQLSRAIPLFRSMGDIQSLATSLAMRAIQSNSLLSETTFYAVKTYKESMQDATEALRLAQQMGSPPGQAFAERSVAMVFTSFGQLGPALTHAQEALRLATEIEHQEWRVSAYWMIGHIYLQMLAPTLALQALETGLSLARELNSALWTTWLRADQAQAYMLKQELPRAEAALMVIMPREQAPRMTPERHVARAWAELTLAQGEPGTALQIAEHLLTSVPGNVSGQPAQPIPHLLKVKGEALIALQRLDQATEVLEAAKQGALERQDRSVLWTVHRSLGRVYQTLRRAEEARREFVAARQLIEELAATIEDASLRDQFLRTALGSLPQETPLPPHEATKRAFGGLTAREYEVAALIAQGKTSREIADLLVVSERTAEGHVSNILGKLGLTSRAQIAAWVVERGLTKH